MTIGHVPTGVAGVTKFLEIGVMLFTGIPPVA
jgi:hypothetical protein